jgi:hypothetical protein
MRDWWVALAHPAAGAGHGCPVAGGSWPGGQPSPPSSQPTAPTAPVDRSAAIMSKLARILVLGVTLAAMNLAGVTAVASAQTTDEPTSNQDARRPPSQGQVGEAWRQQGTHGEPTVAGDTRRPPTESQVGESWRHPTSTPARPAEPSGPSGWLVVSLGVLAAVLVLLGGLAVLAASRAGRRTQLEHPA